MERTFSKARSIFLVAQLNHDVLNECIKLNRYTQRSHGLTWLTMRGKLLSIYKAYYSHYFAIAVLNSDVK